MRLLSYTRLVVAFVISMPHQSMAAEPYLLIEFEGTVTGNTFWCSEWSTACPSTNHFKAPTNDDSMVGSDFWGDVTGKIVVAYTRPEYTFDDRPDNESFQARVPSMSDFTFISGEVSFGARSFVLDRDHQWPGNITLRDFVNIEEFNMTQSQGMRLAQLIVHNNAQSGFDEKTYDQERKLVSRMAAHADTWFSFNFKLRDFKYGTKIFGNMSERSLPSFSWDRSSAFEPHERKGQVRLRDWSVSYSQKSGNKIREYSTTLYYEFDRVKVTSLNGTVPDQPDDEESDESQPPLVPNPVQIQVN